ncbi:hypothetical protein M378DRAFT_181480 [Amanita muscaria Koide BX008]|uniref:Helicase ATP-binding domain-containing protein n=1 Tax=Amanita muscaria (strain Koide BX008) TaxID=946122 RepID=A0A0C2SV33_AMAMK|nr:hypothetical protein M378DRAFT_181480 [Amanita muscaria Koide BX008]
MEFWSQTVDEAHQFRSVSTKQWAVLELLDLAQVKILLTGTLLHTAPKDISALGRLLGIPHFRSETAVKEEKDDNAAFRHARKLDDDGLESRQAQVEAVRRMQAQFSGHILHRTVDSRNWKGQTLLDLLPPQG